MLFRSREVARLQTLVAGTVVSSISNESAKSIPGAVRISANGAGERQNTYRLDGASNTDSYFQENQSFPFPDALQRYKRSRDSYMAYDSIRCYVITPQAYCAGSQ